jgi:hypothetical protein
MPYMRTAGRIDRGYCKILKRDRETKALLASRTLSEDDKTYTAKVPKATCH